MLGFSTTTDAGQSYWGSTGQSRRTKCQKLEKTGATYSSSLAYSQNYVGMLYVKASDIMDGNPKYTAKFRCILVARAKKCFSQTCSIQSDRA